MTYQSTILAHSPTFYLPMTEHAYPLADATGNLHTGQHSFGGTPDPGLEPGFLVGEAGVSFSANFARFEIASGLSNPTTNQWTHEFWLKFDPPAISSNAFHFLFDGATTWNMQLGLASATQVQLFSAYSNVGVPFNSAAITCDFIHCWHYWAFTFDGLGNIRWYRDGALFATLNNPAASGLTITPASGASCQRASGGGNTFGLMHMAFYGTRLSDAQIAANYAAATPRQDAACFSVPIRLRQNTGHVVYEGAENQTKIRCSDQDAIVHDGTTLQVFSGGSLSMQVPFVPSVGAPDRFVGIDPTTGIASAALLPTTATASLSPLVPPVPPVSTPSTCDQLRCGAASNMRLHLEEIYNNWSTVLGGAVKLGEVLGAVAAIASLGELVVGAAILGEFAENVFAAIKPNLQAWIGTIVPNPFPAITIAGDTMIWNGAYCQLTCAGNVVNPTSVQVQAWNTYIFNNSSALVGPSLQLALLNALLDFTPLLDWQTAASSAVANPGCAGFSCP